MRPYTIYNMMHTHTHTHGMDSLSSPSCPQLERLKEHEQRPCPDMQMKDSLGRRGIEWI